MLGKPQMEVEHLKANKLKMRRIKIAKTTQEMSQKRHQAQSQKLKAQITSI